MAAPGGMPEPLVLLRFKGLLEIISTADVGSDDRLSLYQFLVRCALTSPRALHADGRCGSCATAKEEHLDEPRELHGGLCSVAPTSPSFELEKQLAVSSQVSDFGGTRSDAPQPADFGGLGKSSCLPQERVLAVGHDGAQSWICSTCCTANWSSCSTCRGCQTAWATASWYHSRGSSTEGDSRPGSGPCSDSGSNSSSGEGDLASSVAPEPSRLFAEQDTSSNMAVAQPQWCAGLCPAASPQLYDMSVVDTSIVTGDGCSAPSSCSFHDEAGGSRPPSFVTNAAGFALGRACAGSQVAERDSPCAQASLLPSSVGTSTTDFVIESIRSPEWWTCRSCRTTNWAKKIRCRHCRRSCRRPCRAAGSDQAHGLVNGGAGIPTDQSPQQERLSPRGNAAQRAVLGTTAIQGCNLPRCQESGPCALSSPCSITEVPRAQPTVEDFEPSVSRPVGCGPLASQGPCSKAASCADLCSLPRGCPMDAGLHDGCGEGGGTCAEAFASCVSSLEWEVRSTLAKAGGELAFGTLRSELHKLLSDEPHWALLSRDLQNDLGMVDFLNRFDHVVLVHRASAPWTAQLLASATAG